MPMIIIILMVLSVTAAEIYYKSIPLNLFMLSFYLVYVYQLADEQVVINDITFGILMNMTAAFTSSNEDISHARKLNKWHLTVL